jgi:DNA-binding transcriptional ArsR family regulator
MSVPHPIPDMLIEMIAQRFRVLGEPMRIRILDRLRTAPATVQELTEALSTSQQNISKHLGVLAQVGVVTRAKDRNFAVYSIADESVFRLCDEVCGSLQQQVAELHQLMGEEVAR